MKYLLLVLLLVGCGRESDRYQSVCGEPEGKTCNKSYDWFPDECLPWCEEAEEASDDWDISF